MLSIAPALALLAVSASAHPLLTNNHVARHHALAARSEQLADPAGWFHDYLEDYTTYHTRYLAVGCKGQQATEFFESCCHPLLATETLEANRPAECNPANVPASAPTDTEDEEDCEEDEPEASPAASPAPTEEAKPEEAAPSPSPTEEAKPADKPADKPAATTTSETAAPTEDKNNSGNSGNNNSGGEVFSGGRVTWFEQAGGQGHCGEFHGDDDLIAAMNTEQFNSNGGVSGICGKKVDITSSLGTTVTVTIVDSCPGCIPHGIDLSLGAFKALGSLDLGVIDITWKFE